jgi:hypothetical protein
MYGKQTCKWSNISMETTEKWRGMLAPRRPHASARTLSRAAPQCTHVGPARSAPHALPTRSTTRGGPLVSTRMQIGTFYVRSVAPQQLQQVIAASGPIVICATLNLPLQHPNETLATYVRNIRLKHLQNTWKHLKYVANAYNILIYFCNICIKTLATYVWNTWNIETYAYNMHVTQHSDITLEIYVQNNWNPWNIYLQHVYISDCNIGNIQMKHIKTYFLKHLITLEIRRRQRPQPTWWGTDGDVIPDLPSGSR